MNGQREIQGQDALEEIYNERKAAAKAAAKSADTWLDAQDTEEAREEEKPQHPFFELPPLERVQKKSKKERVNEGPELWKILLAVLICMLFAMGSYMVGKVYGATLIPDESAFINPNGEDDDQSALPAEPQGPRILTMLMMGTDQREKNELARADVIILVTMNLDTKEIDMISIPRDTRALIADTQKTTKINHAHSTGGPERMVKTVENLLGLNVHYYVETNFQGFAKCIDILGGINYNVERRMVLLDEGINLQAGQQKLTGDKALQYVRWRGDATADIGRVARQQKFLQAVLQQSMNVATVPKLPSLVAALRENVETDMTTAQMVSLATQFIDIKSLSIEATTLPGEPKYIGGGSYWVMDEEAAKTLIMNIFNPPAAGTEEAEGASEQDEDTLREQKESDGSWDAPVEE